MKNELDSLMQSRNIDALLVIGPGTHNPAMTYLAGGAKVNDAYLIKKRGQPAVLYHHGMERDEAAASGLLTRSLEEYRLDDLHKQMKGDMLQAITARFKLIFKEQGLTYGRVAIYGRYEAGVAYAVFSALRAGLPELNLVGEVDNTVLLAAMATKDQEEVARIRRMGQVTTQVVGNVADFLSTQHVKDELLIKADGAPLTINEVKRYINLRLAERGAENPEGTIFSIGHDAGVPHSTGKDSEFLRLGETIIFDIFPCEAGGGYFYDFTRTWCLGYASDEALALYENVHSVFRRVINELQAGVPFKNYQKFACALFEDQGHSTIMKDPLAYNGYVHGLGHGVGLNIHERPFSRLNGDDENRLDPGTVFTIEPGLYYPERGLGVRLEDTLWMRPDGVAETLAEYPLDLVLPVKRS